MDTKRPCLFGALLVLLAGVAHAGQFEPRYETHFDSSDDLSRWILHSGTWFVTGGKFIDLQTDPTDIATVDHYDPSNFDWPTMFNDYGIDVYASVQNPGGSVGLVYNFQDLANYHEASLSANGVATLRSVINGVVRTDATGSFSAPGTRKWFHISVFHGDGVTQLKVDGRFVLLAIQRGLPQGDAGVVSRGSGQFDDFNVLDFSLVQPYTEDFSDSLANSWGPLSGSWSVLRTGPTTTDLSYVSTVVNATSIALSPIPGIWDFQGMHDPFPEPVTFKARMMNPYGGSGNLIGIAWVHIPSSPLSYVEVVFSPRGQARINAVANGVRTVLAEAPYQGGGPNKWFDVEVAFDGDDFTDEGGRVKVNGVTVFDPLPRSNLRHAEVGFVTHWAPGRFDDVRAAWAVFRGMAATMDDGRFPSEFHSGGAWSVQDGTLKNAAVTATDLAFLDVFHDLADIEFRARIVNHYANAGNLVGLAYANRGADDYFEVVFSPTGVAKMNRVLKGVITNVATASYSGGGQHRWFNVQLIQRQLRTTVKVNGVTVFNEVPQPDTGGASLGLVAHWAKANFDNIFVTELPPAP